MDAFAALADPVRRDLLRQLAVAPTRVVDLAAALPISRPAVSRHLRVLADAGLVLAADRGRERHYRLRPDPLADVTAFVRELAPRRPSITAQQLDALDTEVRRAARDHRADRLGPATREEDSA
jgi:DNA-binding transcriptional ArsR family regulator